MSVSTSDGIVTLSIPASSDEIATLRSFAYAVGRHHGLGDETIEDLKLALSEIAADGIEGGGTAIAVTVGGRPPAVEVAVEVPGASPNPADPAIDRGQIVRTLFPTVRVDHRPGAVLTTFSVEQA
jgi:anti-sigma regulatory factor (Ser/Thr protein kinase)